MEKTVSCIIPVYNEGIRIKNVLEVVIKHPLIKEVIVINDGSTDSTSNELSKFKNIKVINHKKNLGKSRSVMDGLEVAAGEIILFLDADLVGIQSDDVTRLIEPVLQDRADTTISLRKNTLLYARIIGLDYISGERAIKRHFLDDFKELSKIPRWGIESAYLNRKIIKNSLRIKVVPLENVVSPFPSEKLGFIKGNIRLSKMIVEIIRTNGLFYSAYQIFKMWKLKNTSS